MKSKKDLIIKILQEGTVEQLDSIRYMLNDEEVAFANKMLLQFDLMEQKRDEEKHQKLLLKKGVKLC